MSDNGKGDFYRKVNRQKYENEYDRIFKKKLIIESKDGQIKNDNEKRS